VRRVLSPATGRTIVASTPGLGHWNSPVLADGHIVLGESNANAHRTSGVLDIWPR
jgi:hypothetical protein